MNYQDILKNIENKIVIHCGGHEAEEMETYLQYNPKLIIWIEAIPEFANKIQNKIIRYHNHFNHTLQIVINKAIFNQDNKIIKFNICNQPWASSIFELGADRNKYWSHHEITKEILCETITLDTILEQNNLDAEEIELLAIDVQGAEILAFEGGTNLLSKVKNIWTEVTWVETYKNAPQKQDIDNFLLRFNFVEKYKENQGHKEDIESNILYCKEFSLPIEENKTPFTLNKYFDRISCATITSRNDFLEKLNHQIENLGGQITPFKIKEKNSSSTDTFDYVDVDAPVDWQGRNSQSYNYSKCFFEIIRRAQKDKIKTLLYLEDDVCLLPHFQYFVPIIMEGVPKSWDMIYFSAGNMFTQYHKIPTYQFIKPFIYKSVMNIGFQCVAISEKLYPYILELENKAWLNENPYIDLTVMYQFQLGHSEHKTKQFEIYGCYPYLACERESFSNNELKYNIRDEYKLWKKIIKDNEHNESQLCSK